MSSNQTSNANTATLTPLPQAAKAQTAKEVMAENIKLLITQLEAVSPVHDLLIGRGLRQSSNVPKHARAEASHTREGRMRFVPIESAGVCGSQRQTSSYTLLHAA